MKRLPLVFASFVIIGLAAWLALGKRGDSRAGPGETGDAAVNRDASRVSSTAPGKSRDRSTYRPATGSKAEKTLQELVSELANFRAEGVGPNQGASERIREKLDALEVGEILAVLRALDASSISDRDNDKLQLSIWIAAALARKDPELALDEFIRRTPGKLSIIALQLDRFYQSLATKDPAAAAAWLDRQISAGTFGQAEEPNRATMDLRAKFEATLVRSLAITDPAVAAARFAKMDEAARADALKADWFSGVKTENAKALAAFFREISGSDRSPIPLVTAASNRLAAGDLTNAAAFIDALDASPDELAPLVSETLRRRITGKMELLITPAETMAWIQQQAPQDAGRLTGTALAQMIEWHDFPEMAGLAMEHRKQTGSDDVLIAFLKNAPDGAKQQILELAGEISDPLVRAEVVGRFK